VYTVYLRVYHTTYGILENVAIAVHCNLRPPMPRHSLSRSMFKLYQI